MIIENEGDLLKVEQLYQRYKRLLYKVANTILNDKYLSEDAVHQTFVRIINNLHKIGEINCPQTQTFLVIICRNVAISLYNKRTYLNNRNDFIDEMAEENEDFSGNPSEIAISRENVERIVSAIKELKPIYQDVLLLNKVYGYSVDEIVGMLGSPRETVKKRIIRAKGKLLGALARERIG